MRPDHAETEGSTGVSKTLTELNGFDLRRQAREGAPEPKRRARAELRRRVGNLRDAVVPDWEKAERGPDPSKWDLLRA